MTHTIIHMTTNIFQQFKEETQNVFHNIKYLDPECLPREFHYRDNELHALANNISPVFQDSVPIHTVITGENAVGKTTAIMKLWEQLREALPECIPVYINCRRYNTEYKVYGELFHQVMGVPAPERGSNSRKLYSDVMRKLELTRQPLLVALDDAQIILGDQQEGVASRGSQNIIRNLVRANDAYGNIVGVFPVVTGDEFRYRFDCEVSSLFVPGEVHFKGYGVDEVRGIICERVECAFDVRVDGAVLDGVVGMVMRSGNVRDAWRLLKTWGLLVNQGFSQRVAWSRVCHG